MSSRSVAAERSDAALGDLREQQLVDLHQQLAQARQRISTAQPAREQHAELQGGRGRVAQQQRQPLVQARVARRVGDAEHRLQDHIERDRLHPRVDRERVPIGPAVELAFGDLL